MSFILDALRRSERERGKTTPDTVPAPEHGLTGARLTVARIVVLILLVNATLAGLWWWWRGGARETPVAVAPATVPAPVPTAPSAAAPLPPAPAGFAPGPEPSTPEPAPAQAPALTLPPPPPPRGPVVLDPRVVPFLSQLPEDFQRALPPMTVNIHVYVPDESARLLFINNRQVQKGEWLSGAVRLEEIVPDGAVLSYQGVRFRLPRPR